jgi:hypothetical protein
MGKRVKHAERYQLTPKGLLSLIIDNEELSDKLYNELIVYMYKIKLNGIVLIDGELHFTELEKS